MRVCRERPSRTALGLLAGLFLVFCAGARAAPIDDAVGLYNRKKWAEAEAILAPLVLAEPTNARACYYLGMAFLNAGGTAALDNSREMLGRATRLAPDNAGYLADYAGVCLLLADRDNSLSFALEGRDSMIKAIALNPADLDARDGLMEFYARAPWPIGDARKAMEQASEIAKRDPKRGLAAYHAVARILERAGRHEESLAATEAAQRLAAAAPP